MSHSFKHIFILCLFFAVILSANDFHPNSSGIGNESLSKLNNYGIITITTWADDRNAAFSFSFDDGFISQYENVREILNQNNFNGTFYILPPFLTDSLPGIWRYGTWPMFLQMSSEGHELGSHTLHHDSLPQLPVGDTLTPGTIHYELYHSKRMIEERNSYRKCITFAYPFAVHNPLVDSLAGIYYESARVAGNIANQSVINGDDWLTLSAYEVGFSMPRNTPDDDIDELNSFIAWISSTIANGEWGIHLAHEVVPFSEINALIAAGAYEPISNEWLTSLCDWLSTKRNNNELWVESIADVTKYVKEREDFYYNIMSQSNVLIEIEAGDDLPDDIYNYPLTAHITVPPDWEYVKLEQGSRSDILQAFILDTSTVVMGNIIPDDGILKLTKHNPNNIVNNNIEQPAEIKLYQNYPNPFNPSTTISYSVKNRRFVSLKIYDVLGNEMITLVNDEKAIGKYSINFNAEDLPAGVYVIFLQAGEFHSSKKMVLLK